MILLEQINKEVDYFGLSLSINKKLRFIAVDAYGLMYGFTKCPQYKQLKWVIIGKGERVFLGRVNLENKPASSTLMEFKTLWSNLNEAKI